MKKIPIITLLLTILVFVSCNSVGGNEGTGATKDPKDGVVNRINTETFRKLVWDYQKNPNEWIFKGDLPCIIDFYADWCRPCKMISPIMDELALQYKGKVRFYKINTDEERELAGVFTIRSIPALLYVPKNGKPQMSVGLSSKETYIKSIGDVLLKQDTLKK